MGEEYTQRGRVFSLESDLDVSGPGAEPRVPVRSGRGLRRADLRTGTPPSRCALRRPHLHRHHVNGHLLPPDLSFPARQARSCPLLPLGGGGFLGRLPSVPALPSGSGTGYAGLEWHFNDREPGSAAHCGGRSR